MSAFSSISWSETRELYKDWFKWRLGRQKTGYDGFMLFTWPWLIPWHALILRFPEGSRIPPHRDKVADKRHFRLNIVIWPSKKGGQFICETPFFQSKYINFFRSDLCKHEVSEVKEGTRFVLSIGWVLK